jgi:hypothetical protein
MYDVAKSNLQSEINQIEKIAITHDMWTPANTVIWYHHMPLHNRYLGDERGVQQDSGYVRYTIRAPNSKSEMP